MADTTSRGFLGGLRAGNDDAFKRLDRHPYQVIIGRSLWAIVRRASAVDEVRQNVRIRVYEKIGGFRRRSRGDFRRWLRGVSRNCAREFLRARPRGQGDLVDSLPDRHCELHGQSGDVYLRPWVAAVLDEAKRRCGDEKITAYLKYHRDDWQVTDVAYEMKLPSWKVYKYIAEVTRCIRQIKAEWSDDLFDK